MKTFEIKEGNEAKDMQYMSAKLFMVWGYFLMFAKKHELPVVITNIKHKFAVSKSNTHPEGRAVDVSVRGWSSEDIQKCVEYLTHTVGDYGAISARTGTPRVVYYHNAGLGPHFHIQVSRE